MHLCNSPDSIRPNIITHSHRELDLTNQQAVRTFFAQQQIDYIVLAAARVGGIHANNRYPAEFIYQNMMIEVNVIHEADSAGVRNLLFLGSSCIYPKFANQPIKETWFGFEVYTLMCQSA
jgi:GDP-L-fucose synthase